MRRTVDGFGATGNRSYPQTQRLAEVHSVRIPASTSQLIESVLEFHQLLSVY